MPTIHNHDPSIDGYFDPAAQHKSYEHFLSQRENPFQLPLTSGPLHKQAQLCRFSARVHKVDSAYFEDGHRLEVCDVRDFKGHSYSPRGGVLKVVEDLRGIRAGAVVSFTARFSFPTADRPDYFKMIDVTEIKTEWQPAKTARLADTQSA